MAKPQAKLPTLDLHGMTTDEVPDAIDRFLMQCTNKKTPRSRIMTGKGTGKVKQVAIDYLKKAGYPWQHEKMGNGQNNEGVLVVFFD